MNIKRIYESPTPPPVKEYQITLTPDEFAIVTACVGHTQLQRVKHLTDWTGLNKLYRMLQDTYDKDNYK